MCSMIPISTLAKRYRQLTVLEVLHSSPSHPMELYRKLNGTVRQSTLYSTLKSLAALHYVNGTTHPDFENQTIYTLSQLGKDFLYREKIALTLETEEALRWCKHVIAHISSLQNRMLRQ